MSAENNDPEHRVVGRPFPAGTSGNPGGRPRQLSAIEKMLNDEFRTVEGVREAMTKLREIAIEGTEKGVYFKGILMSTEREYNAAYMAMYLDRIAGKVTDAPIDLSDAPDEAMDYLRTKFRQ